MPERVPTAKLGPWMSHVSRHRDYDRLSRDRAAKAFYDSKAWRDLRLLKLRQSPLCECCVSADRLTSAAVVHHKRPVSEAPDLRLELSNLVSLCWSCHSRLHSSLPPEGGEFFATP